VVSELTRTVDELADAVRRSAGNADMGRLLQRLQRNAQSVEIADLDSATARLCALVVESGAVDPDAAAGALFACGILIEAGADALPPAPAVLAYSRASVASAAVFQRALQSAWAAASHDGELSRERQEAIVREAGERFDSEAIHVGNLFRLLAPPLLGVLLRCRSARQRVRADDSFAADLATFARYDTEPEGVIHRVLSALDDDALVVLHPSTQQGFRVSVGGITNIFQLQCLLGDLLIGVQLPGRRPGPAVVDACRAGLGETRGHASFAVATAIGKLAYDSATSEIPTIEGEKAVILSSPVDDRLFRAGRPWPEMVGTCELVEVLTAQEVERRRSGLTLPPLRL
jgi:hypothetical protein